MRHFDQHNILCDNQHGFRKKRSCETQLIVTIQDIAKNLSKGRQVDIILLDFAKAFDKVLHARLLHKLDFYGVRGSAHSLETGNSKYSWKIATHQVQRSCQEYPRARSSAHFYFSHILTTYQKSPKALTLRFLLMTRSSSDLLLTNMIVTYCSKISHH